MGWRFPACRSRLCPPQSGALSRSVDFNAVHPVFGPLFQKLIDVALGEGHFEGWTMPAG